MILFSICNRFTDNEYIERAMRTILFLCTLYILGGEIVLLLLPIFWFSCAVQIPTPSQQQQQLPILQRHVLDLER